MGTTARAALVLGAWVAFAVLAIGVRGAMQRRRTGSSGIVGFRMGGTGAERVVIAGMATAALAALFASVAGLFGLALRGPVTVPPAIVGAGLLLAALSIAATFWAQLAMGESWRIGLDRAEHTPLVTSGPYHFVRNPIFTAMLALYVGVAAVLPGPVMFLGLAAAFVAIEVTVRGVEEPYLCSQHDDAYARWVARTGRFVPGVGRT